MQGEVKIEKEMGEIKRIKAADLIGVDFCRSRKEG